MDVQIVTYPVQEWILDEKTGQLGQVIQNIDAIAQDVKFALMTERNKYPIMGSNFGVEFESLIGQDPAFVRANIKKRISDALSIDDRIDSVSDFKFSHSEETMTVTFVVNTKLGKLNMTTDVII